MFEAKDLINTKHLPSGLASVRDLALEAAAYHRLDAYPAYHFKDWKVEDRGPLPKVTPFVRTIVRRSARWLFGRPVNPTVPKNQKLEEFVLKAWEANRLDSRLVAMAEKAGVEGGIVLKFAYDEKRRGHPLAISALSPISQVRMYHDPHDHERLLMARVQYPYFDPVKGETYWYREEWTDEFHVVYQPVQGSDLGRDLATQQSKVDAHEGWLIKSQKANPFKLIPLHHVKNLETDDCWGTGDCWGLYRIIDRINLCWHLMDRSNQFDSQVSPIFLDAELRDEGPVQAQQPGVPVEAESTSSESGADYKGQIVFPPTGNSLRPAMMEYACKLQKMVQNAASSVEVDQAEFSNKGNLTNAVLAQLYLPQIEATEEKRKAYGQDGLVPFFDLVARGLQNANIESFDVTDDPESSRLELAWPEYFELSENEKAARLGRVQEGVFGGMLTKERAIEAFAQIEGIEDVAALKNELKAEPQPSGNINDPNYLDVSEPVKRSISQTARLRQIGGKEAE
jgi:hypothetical protein